MTAADLATARDVAAVLAEIRELRAELAELRRSQPPRLVSVAVASAQLGISPCSVRRHVADGTLPSRRIGGRVLVDLSAAQPAADAEIAQRAREARA